MKNKLLTSFVLDNLQSIEQHLSSFIKEKKPKYLHRLRVDIKEIKAVYSFSDYVYKKNTIQENYRHYLIKQEK